MSITAILISILVFGVIISAVMLIKQSATKFNLTEEQKVKIKEREKALQKEEAEEDK